MHAWLAWASPPTPIHLNHCRISPIFNVASLTVKASELRAQHYLQVHKESRCKFVKNIWKKTFAAAVLKKLMDVNFMPAISLYGKDNEKKLLK